MQQSSSPRTIGLDDWIGLPIYVTDETYTRGPMTHAVEAVKWKRRDAG